MELPSNDRWSRINELLVEAKARPAEERATFLEEACGADAALRDHVESLLSGVLHPAPCLRTAPGTQVGHYQMQEVVGRGRTSMVYCAVRTDDPFEREFAIKVLRRVVDPAAETAGRFRAERQILASLSPPISRRCTTGA